MTTKLQPLKMYFSLTIIWHRTGIVGVAGVNEAPLEMPYQSLCYCKYASEEGPILDGCDPRCWIGPESRVWRSIVS